MRISQHRVLKILRYDEATGHFFNRYSRGRQAKAGSRAGTKTPAGYIVIKLYGRSYPASRLAWLYKTGQWPRRDMDHINRKRDDNSWGNLRHATRRQNMRNASTRRDNLAGVRGVCIKRPDRYRARIFVRRKSKHLGYFKTIDAAKAAVHAARLKFFGEFAPTM